MKQVHLKTKDGLLWIEILDNGRLLEDIVLDDEGCEELWLAVNAIQSGKPVDEKIEEA